MVASSAPMRKAESHKPAYCSKVDSGRYRIRTYDFHRVNFEFNELKPFACFAFLPPMGLQNRRKPPSFLVPKGNPFGAILVSGAYHAASFSGWFISPACLIDAQYWSHRHRTSASVRPKS
jgi:hypothetical protein